MNNRRYEIYRDIMSTNPIIDKSYLHSILHLSENQNISNVELTEVKESNTALGIKAIVKILSTDKIYLKKLFIKTIKHDESKNGYHDMSMQEGKFYKIVHDNSIKGLPIPICYDVFISEEAREFVIVLEDISDQYIEPDDSSLSDKNTWLSCADTLARFHSIFWNSKIIDTLKLNSETDVEIESKSQMETLQKFLNHFNDEFDKKTKDIFMRAMEINISLMKEENRRLNSKENVTIRNGDSHVYNFMLPIERKNSPLMIDFQFWGEGIGVGDLAHLTRVNFSNKLKEEIQLSVIESYHNALMKYGVTDYSWKNCFKDYCSCVASMVLIPFYQYSYHNVQYNEWIGNLEGLIFNYEYLKCDEI